MIIYNVTVQLDKEVHQEWLQWMKNKHIPEVMASGQFLDYRIFRLIDESEEVVTYACQYQCESMDNIHRYQETYAPALQADHRKRYDGRFVAFRTLLEDVGST